MGLPLEGVRVLDMAQVFAGPATAMYLADFGADVIKVEPPGGDACRAMHTAPSLGDQSKPFVLYNRNKRSLVLDITRPEGREVLSRLLRTADVMIANLRPGVDARLGLDYDSVRAINPRLIYANITAFDTRGPLADRGAYDLIVQARTGFVASLRLPDGTPLLPTTMVCDLSVPLFLAYGICMALMERARSGQGQKVETSLLHAAIAMQNYQLVRADRDPRLPGLGTSSSNLFKCRDGEFILVIALNDRQWAAFCRVAGQDEFADHPRYNTYMKRLQNRPEVEPLFEKIFLTRTRDHWLGVLEKANVPCSAVISREDVFSDPQVLANEVLVDHAHPVAGPVKMMGLPVQLSRTPGAIRTPSPGLGEHTVSILRELGYSDREVRALQDSGTAGAGAKTPLQ